MTFQMPTLAVNRPPFQGQNCSGAKYFVGNLWAEVGYQANYEVNLKVKLAGAGGFEPPATGFGDQRSGQTELRSCVVPLEGFEPPTRDLGRRRSIL